MEVNSNSSFQLGKGIEVSLGKASAYQSNVQPDRGNPLVPTRLVEVTGLWQLFPK